MKDVVSNYIVHVHWSVVGSDGHVHWSVVGSDGHVHWSVVGSDGHVHWSVVGSDGHKYNNNGTYYAIGKIAQYQDNTAKLFFTRLRFCIEN